MNLSRRHALSSALLGASALGLRALATGLPASFLMNPRKAFAQSTCPAPSKAQYFILCTTSGGDPVNGNVPGTYEDPALIHSADPSMAPVSLSLSGTPHTAATPWSKIPQEFLDRTAFFHLMTGTPVHTRQPDVMKLMGATKGGEMLVSLLAAQLAPCLGTIQRQPLQVSSSINDALSFQGAAQPIIPPTALKATLGGPNSPLNNLAPLRDQTLNQLYELYKHAANADQRAYVDSMVTSQRQLRNINQGLLDTLSSITDDSATSQIRAAVTLIQMNVTPVVSVYIPFGQDNHADIGLAQETKQTVAGVQTIVDLLGMLKSANLQDKVTFMTLNVFGRTLGMRYAGGNGRNHNGNHQVSVVIGKPFKGSVLGGVGPVGTDYGAVAFDSHTGAMTPNGDITPGASLASFGKTMLTSAGCDDSVINADYGKVITAALA
jgi:hypothetical protein